MKFIFFHCGWMEFYNGYDGEITGGGSFVDKNGFGYEMSNFECWENKAFGYVENSLNDCNITRLGAGKNDKSISDIMIFFTAKRPKNGGVYVVGWYCNATLYKKMQKYHYTYKDSDEDQTQSYYASATYSDTVLLPIDERIWFKRVPYGKKGGMGRSNIWYADTDIGRAYVAELLEFIQNREKQRKNPTYSVDVEARKRIEKTAINTVSTYYQNMGYTIESFESKNVGWDLSAKKNDIQLNIEVKGLSGIEIKVVLTANELKYLKEKNPEYRLAVVLDCRNKPLLHIFHYSEELQCWIDDEKNKLGISEKVSAICYIDE